MTEPRRPRVAVTLSDEALDIVQRLAAIEKTSASKVIASVIEEFLPVARQLVALGESVGDLDEGKKSQLAMLAQQMETGLIPKNEELLKSFTDTVAQAQQIVREK